MKPLIGVTPLYDDEKKRQWMKDEYLDALLEAGALPVVLPLRGGEEAGSLADALDGILFTGGQDLNPALYGEEESGSQGLCPERDALETRLLSAALAADMPVLGVCRGFQMLNVHLGGSLYQDLPTQYRHTGPAAVHQQESPYDVPAHEVHVFPWTPLSGILGARTVRVNSLHHQGVRRLAPALVPAAASPDGLTEAAVLPGEGKRFVVAVQWHPEFLFRQDVHQRRLIEAFAAACGERAV